jgi:hypothetical protein
MTTSGTAIRDANGFKIQFIAVHSSGIRSSLFASDDGKDA